MEGYERPVVFLNEELAEGIYAASGAVGDIGGGGAEVGDTEDAGSGSGGVLGCGSMYMNGIWERGDDWTKNTYRAQVGCNGCEAYTATGCGLQNGKPLKANITTEDLRPSWEKAGRGPDERTW
jgi:hypothetical protein